MSLAGWAAIPVRAVTKPILIGGRWAHVVAWRLRAKDNTRALNTTRSLVLVMARSSRGPSLCPRPGLKSTDPPRRSDVEIGFFFWPFDVALVHAMARAADDFGYDMVGVADTPGNAMDPWVATTLVATATRR